MVLKEKRILGEPTEKPPNNTETNEDEDMSTDPFESSNDHCSEENTSNIIKDLETDEGSLTCRLCDVANEHPCQMCGRPVCNLVCSIPDPSSDNEMRRVHKPVTPDVFKRPLNVRHAITFFQPPKTCKNMQRGMLKNQVLL